MWEHLQVMWMKAKRAVVLNLNKDDGDDLHVPNLINQSLMNTVVNLKDRLGQTMRATTSTFGNTECKLIAG